MIDRFVGPENRDKRIKVLCDQYIINGNAEFATFFADHCEPLFYSKGQKIIEQEGSDTDLYFIVAGSADVYVNERPIAVRDKRIHVGEMALMDETAKRSASVIVREDTVAFRVAQADFCPYANENPELWQRIAIELANRLRERSKFIRVPNPKPMVFIGSSSEFLSKAKQVQDVIGSAGIDVKCWDDGDLFALSETTLDELIDILDAYDFAIFYVSGDDKLNTRGATVAQPRDNVILELGMGIGSLGKERTFILVDGDPKPNLPSDLKGVTYLPVSFDGGKLNDATVEMLKKKLVARIFSDGVK